MLDICVFWCLMVGKVCLEYDKQLLLGDFDETPKKDLFVKVTKMCVKVWLNEMWAFISMKEVRLGLGFDEIE